MWTVQAQYGSVYSGQRVQSKESADDPSARPPNIGPFVIWAKPKEGAPDGAPDQE